MTNNGTRTFATVRTKIVSPIGPQGTGEGEKEGSSVPDAGARSGASALTGHREGGRPMPQGQRAIGILTLCAAFLLGGCSNVAVRTVRFPEVQTYPPTYPDIVEVLRTSPVRPHAQLGEVYVEPEGNASPDKIAAGLQKGAAPLGADAVVIVADRALKMGALVETSWEKRSLLPTPDHVVVGVAIRYLQ